MVDGAPWTICCKVHVIRGVRVSHVMFRSSVTVWTPTTAGRRRAGRLAKEWRQQRQREIRGHGYRGRWRRSPCGPVGDFWKTLQDARAASPK
jgi:hypothetical protein